MNSFDVEVAERILTVNMELTLEKIKSVRTPPVGKFEPARVEAMAGHVQVFLHAGNTVLE